MSSCFIEPMMGGMCHTGLKDIRVKSTLQARNSLIGNFTEKWVSDLLNYILQDDNFHVIQQAQIPSIGITHNSPADIVISTENKKVLMPDEVKLIFEVKMSLVWNWQYDVETSRESKGNWRLPDPSGTSKFHTFRFDFKGNRKMH